MNPIKEFLTGADNQSLAIGRVLGTLLYLDAALALPAIVAGSMLTQHVGVDDWMKLLDHLPTYLLAVTGCAIGLIAGTAFTEPKPPVP